MIFTLKCLELAAVGDDKLLSGNTSLCAQLSHLLHHIHAFPHPAESHVFEVQVFGFLQGDEELRVVCVTASIGHGQYARACVPNIEVLVLKLAAIDGLASCAITVGDVTTLKEQRGTC